MTVYVKNLTINGGETFSEDITLFSADGTGVGPFAGGAGGGGAGGVILTRPGTPGTANTGSGGGGAGADNWPIAGLGTGGNGADGIVIIRYAKYA